MSRWNNLFVRLLVAQAVTASCLVLLFGALFYVERNRTIARLVAHRWAPVLRAATSAEHLAPPALAVVRRTELPQPAVTGQAGAPRVAELMQTLRANGVDALDIAFSPSETNPLIWVAVQLPGGQRVWLGFVDELVEPQLPQRIVIAIAFGIVVVAAASWLVARRVARPLEKLRGRMEAHEPDAAEDGTDSELAPGAAAEVAAIARAWRETRARLARHERERQLLLAGVSHDLRSPLARARLAADLLPEVADVAEWREAIVRNIDVADRLIESFLDHVRAGELPLDEAVDVAAVARGVVATLGRGALEFELISPSSLPAVHCNRLLVERLLQNLLDNAFKHGRAPVRLRLGGGGAAPVRIDVEDCGTGIPPDQREHLLQAFARGDASRARPGTGLGLAVVQRIIARLGGTLSFELAPGLHRVHIELPPPRGTRADRLS